MRKTKTSSKPMPVAAVLLALSAVTAAPAAVAADNASWTVAQAENPCSGRKRSSNPCGPSNPCGSRRQRRSSSE